ncbi:MAG: winged helix DNA-binding protein [Allosphingosinicella sp.]|uniref:winged helix DNA-binding protein n=1 Tax=Allosphingosinicella sp. TaxID=2823234 RepID=UPI00392692D7
MALAFAHQVLEMIHYSDEPAVLLFGDSEEGLVRARRAAERAGCRVADAALISASVQRLDAQVSASTIFVAPEQESPALDLVLDRMEAMARTERRMSVVAAPAAMTDAIVARAFDSQVHHLIDESEERQSACLALASAFRSDRVAEPRGAAGMAVLAQLSEEAARIADTLASLSEGELVVSPAHQNDEHEGVEVSAGQVRAIIRARRMRDQFFRGEIFADPAFDMLLDLYAARLEGHKVAVSSLCIAAAVPATTALRWIKQLTDRGLFVRQADPQDGRRIYIDLSEAAAKAMANYLAAVQRIAPTVI